MQTSQATPILWCFLHKCDERKDFQLIVQMKPLSNLMAQLISIIVCTGLTKTHTLLSVRSDIYAGRLSGLKDKFHAVLN